MPESGKHPFADTPAPSGVSWSSLSMVCLCESILVLEAEAVILTNPHFTCTVGLSEWDLTLSALQRECSLSRTPTLRNCQDIPLPISRVRDVKICKQAGEGWWLLGYFECKICSCERRVCVVILGSPRSISLKVSFNFCSRLSTPEVSVPPPDLWSFPSSSVRICFS